jgi:hypothetical protein
MIARNTKIWVERHFLFLILFVKTFLQIQKYISSFDQCVQMALEGHYCQLNHYCQPAILAFVKEPSQAEWR